MTLKTEIRKPAFPAALAAIALVIVSGLGYRSLAMYLARPTNSSALPAGTLASMPMQIGDWQGQDVPLDEAVIRITDTDDLLNRHYCRYGGSECVGFYIAYGIRARDLLPHRPEVCYPDAGWTLGETRKVNLGLPDHSSIECTVYRFHRSGLAADTITVLNYYIVDGQYCSDVSLLRRKALLWSSGVRYMAQVQITCTDRAFRGGEETIRSVQRFALDSGPLIRTLLQGGPARPPVSASPDPDASGQGDSL